jgi:hypothetical protein
MTVANITQLEPGVVYSWDELAAAFDFRPNYFSAAGGMVPSRSTDSLLLITHPGGGKSFDYQDYWDGQDLIYTGKGKVGDQQRTQQNLDVAENRRALFVFEAAGSRQLLFLGRAESVEERTGRAPDGNGEMRNVLQFRLTFRDGRNRAHLGAAPARGTTTPPSPRASGTPERTPRPFQGDAPPPAPSPTSSEPANPELIAAKREKANAGHHAILKALTAVLTAMGCSNIEEIPSAVDLWATRPDGVRVLFEAKTISATNELSQTRGGFAQLQEYRIEYGSSGDELCLVVDRPLSVRRQKLLASLGIAVLVRTGGDFDAANDSGSQLIDNLASSGAQR